MFAARIRAFRPDGAVVTYGCPGETTISFVTGPYRFRELGNELHDDYAGSQLDAALGFLRTHPGQVSPITVTLWGNDVGRFFDSCGGDFGCILAGAPAAIAGLASRIARILDELRTEAPDAEIIVTGHWNTNLGFFPETDPALPGARQRHAPGEDCAQSPLRGCLPGLQPAGDPDDAAAAIFAFTLLCSEGDSHPSDLGYRANADVVFDASDNARLEAEE